MGPGTTPHLEHTTSKLLNPSDCKRMGLANNEDLLPNPELRQKNTCCRGCLLLMLASASSGNQDWHRPCCCTFRLPLAVVEWCCASTCLFYSKLATVTKQQQSEYERRNIPQEPVRSWELSV